MDFFEKMRQRITRWMAGRNGMDKIALTLLWAWPVLYILGLLTRSVLLLLLAYAAIAYSAFRVCSRNVAKRREEEALFLNKTAPVRKKLREYRGMLKNSKTYVYFSCPQCRAKLRVPRGVGQITVTCKQCGHKFEKKA